MSRWQIKRIPVSKQVRKSVIERDGQKCKKCGRQYHLVAHHLEAYMDGGSNEPNNLITLCQNCHSEWHVAESVTGLPFDVWLTIPPYAALIAGYLKSDEFKWMSVSGYHAAMKQAVSMYMSIDTDES